MTTEAPDVLSTLRTAKQLYEDAHSIWFKAMDTARWSYPIRDETVIAAYNTTGKAIEMYARAMHYMEDLIRTECEAVRTLRDAPERDGGDTNG